MLSENIIQSWYNYFKAIYDIDGSYPSLVSIDIEGFNGKGQLESRTTFMTDKEFMFTIHTRSIFAGGYNIQRLHNRFLQTLWATIDGKYKAIGDYELKQEYINYKPTTNKEKQALIKKLYISLAQRNKKLYDDKNDRDSRYAYVENEDGDEELYDYLKPINDEIAEIRKQIRSLS